MKIDLQLILANQVPGDGKEPPDLLVVPEDSIHRSVDLELTEPLFVQCDHKVKVQRGSGVNGEKPKEVLRLKVEICSSQNVCRPPLFPKDGLADFQKRALLRL